MPSFQQSVLDAYNEMTSLESPNDFFIAAFAQGGTDQLELQSKGRGGLEKVKEILKESFESEVAIVMFRLTAVDDRGGKVKSYRTKLVHLVYVGPKTPVMKRAKVASWNSVFKQPFTMNLSLQTDDVDGDLAIAQIERALRSSGGAHQPTYFDFANTPPAEGAVVSENSFTLPSPKASPSPTSPTNVPRSPGGTRSYVACWNEQNRAFHARNLADLKLQYAEDSCKLIITDISTGSMKVFELHDAIAQGFQSIFEQYRDEFEIVKVEKTQPDVDHTSEGIVFSYWTSEKGSVSGAETLCIVGGKIVVHTIVLSRSAPHHQEVVQEEEVQEEETASQATGGEQEEDASASNIADAGDIPSQQEETGDADDSANAHSQEGQTTPEPQESVDDDFVEVEQPSITTATGDDEREEEEEEEEADTTTTAEQQGLTEKEPANEGPPEPAPEEHVEEDSKGEFEEGTTATHQ